MSPRAASARLLNASRDGDCTSSLGSLVQRLTARPYPERSKLASPRAAVPVASSCPKAPSRRGTSELVVLDRRRKVPAPGVGLTVKLSPRSAAARSPAARRALCAAPSRGRCRCAARCSLSVPSRIQGARPLSLSAAARAVLGAGRWGGDGGKQQLTLHDVAELIRKQQCRRVVVMAGAGISTPSGIPDFR